MIEYKKVTFLKTVTGGLDRYLNESFDLVVCKYEDEGVLEYDIKVLDEWLAYKSDEVLIEDIDFDGEVYLDTFEN